ncbi:Nucleoplasmin-3, partial [Ophiophagus hannah]
MASFLDLDSMDDGEATPPICTSRFVFGCELNSSARSYTFKVSEEDDSDHFLALNMACLSEGAKDECNIVEVVGRDYQNKEVAVPVANLKLSCQPWTLIPTPAAPSRQRPSVSWLAGTEAGMLQRLQFRMTVNNRAEIAIDREGLDLLLVEKSGAIIV